MAIATKSRMILYSIRKSHGIVQNDQRDLGKTYGTQRGVILPTSCNRIGYQHKEARTILKAVCVRNNMFWFKLKPAFRLISPGESKSVSVL